MRRINDPIMDLMVEETDAAPLESAADKPQVLDADLGREGIIGRQQIAEAMGILQKYKSAKANLDNRVKANEEWFRLRHWDIQDKSKTPLKPATSAWLFNSIANKHADAMDNYPAINVLPREQSDEKAAEILSSVLPVVFEHNDYEEVYDQKWWYKLRTGTSVEGVFWDASKNNGLGDVSIKKVDILNLFWEPGITDIQDSRNLFNVSLVDSELLEEQYPFMKDKTGGAVGALNAEYAHDDFIDNSGKSMVVDWYYKVNRGGKTILHFCKFCNGEVLWASENHPDFKETGWYHHGQYPFVFDTLFPVADSPVGFGYIDIMKDPQVYIDRLQTAVLENAIVSAKKRHFVSDDAEVDTKAYADIENALIPVHGRIDPNSIVPVTDSPLPGICLSVLEMKIEELKETSGNRDVNQGGSASGVTAASAIAALQEAGSKLSRDMLKASYNAFRKVNILVVELIRQFYDEPRLFRIIGPDGKPQFVPFDNSAIAPIPLGNDFGVDLGSRTPVFDFKVSTQKASPYSKVAQNELALQLYGAGFFHPDNATPALACVQMMDFDDKDEVIETIQRNDSMMKMMQQQQMMIGQLQQQLGMLTGVPPQPITPPIGGAPTPSAVPDIDLDKADEGVVGKAKAATREASAPR